jgi:putative phosphoesterase
MIIGVVSDTHNFLDPLIIEHFRNCDEIWHAGDIGSAKLLSPLENIKPLFAVYGNIDDKETSLIYPVNQILEREGLKFLLTHIAGKPPYYTSRVKKILKEEEINVLICGHSHIVKVEKDKNLNNCVYINPGAAGKQGFHHKRTIMKMTIESKKITNLDLIELGKR